MLNLSVLTWLRFVIWMVIGLAIYFSYGYTNALIGPRYRRRPDASRRDAAALTRLVDELFYRRDAPNRVADICSQ
jgi:hypothetical protein